MPRRPTPIWDRLLPKLDVQDRFDPAVLPEFAGVPILQWPDALLQPWFWTGARPRKPLHTVRWYNRWDEQGFAEYYRQPVGVIRHEGRYRNVHVVLWELLVGPVPADRCVRGKPGLRSILGPDHAPNVNPAAYYLAPYTRRRGRPIPANLDAAPLPSKPPAVDDAQDLAELIDHALLRGVPLSRLAEECGFAQERPEVVRRALEITNLTDRL